MIFFARFFKMTLLEEEKMKPKHLKCPFTWETRAPVFTEGVLFVPEYYQAHGQISWGFSRSAPIYIEYCSGNGAWIIDKAMAHPEFNWIAVEKRFDRVRKIWAKARNRQLTNLLVVCGEALPFTEHYLEADRIAGCYVNFPDPWPKEKHAKHRLFQPAFVQQVSRVLLPEGKVTIVTDDAPWAEEICLAHLAL
jgi:tRNA (guanine-N7-)-methyltransferase